MRKPGEITNGHKDLRGPQRIIILTKWWTNWQTDWQTDGVTVWTEPLKCSQFEVWSLSVLNRQKAREGILSNYRPLSLLWLHQKDMITASSNSPLPADVPLGNTFLTVLPLFVSASGEKGQVVSTGQVFLLTAQIRVRTPAISPLWKLLFFLVRLCQWDLKKAGLICGTAERRPFPQ